MACIAGMLYMTMVVCTLILKTGDEIPGMEAIVIGPFRFSSENMFTAIISVAITSPIIMIVAFLFKNAENAEEGNEYASCLRKGYKTVNDVVKIDKSVVGTDYEGCSNMNASSFITFFTYMLRQKWYTFLERTICCL